MSPTSSGREAISLANDEMDIKADVAPETTGELEAIKERRRNRWKEFWPRVITLVLAIVIWIFIMEINPPDAYKTFENVPVNIIAATDASVTPADGGELTVDITVVAKKNLSNALDPSQITLVIDVSGVQESGIHQVDILCALPSGYKVQKLSKESITVSVDLGAGNP